MAVTPVPAPTALGGSVLSLSRVRQWSTGYLTEATDHWTRTAVQWEDHYSALASQIGMPGGTPWDGDAAEAAFQRAHDDRMRVIGLADELHGAARIARTGADDISWARDAVLRVADTAENAGFVVGEDFSVTKPGVYHPVAAAIMQARAEAIAADLRTAVGTLIATDTEVATRLTAATATLGTEVFTEPGVQPVDYKTGPPMPEPGTPDDHIGRGERRGGQAPEIPPSLPNAPSPRIDPSGPRPAPSEELPWLPRVAVPAGGGGNPDLVTLPRPPQGWGQCISDEMDDDNIGWDMVKGGFKSGAVKAIAAGAFGAGATPEFAGAGALPLAVLGFVGGFTQGVFLAPAEDAAKAAFHCYGDAVKAME